MTSHIRSLIVRGLSVSSIALVAAMATSTPVAAQSSLLLQLQKAGSNRLLADTAGGLVAFGNPAINCTTIPATGAGTRMMWYPCKAAFRAGSVDGWLNNAWDDVNVGPNSMASGYNNQASGNSSFTAGTVNVVSGLASSAVGAENTVSGTFGFSAGHSNGCTKIACIALGQSAQANGEYAIAIGSSVTANGDYSFALGHDATTNNKFGAFLWSDASGNGGVISQAANEFRVRATGGIAFRTSLEANGKAGSNGNTGCDLAPGSGSWSCASSRYLKENFADVDGEEVLAKISAMPVTTWNYITEDKAVRHMGPVAQDFYSAFALGTDSSSIGMIDINGVNLAAVKALEQRTAALTTAQAQLAEKAKRIDALEDRVARLEKALGKQSK